MGKTIAKVELYSPGIVIFDPAVFYDFLKHKNVNDSNIFQLFLNDKVLGRSAIKQGVLLPMCPVPEDEYSVFMENSIHWDTGWSLSPRTICLVSMIKSLLMVVTSLYRARS